MPRAASTRRSRASPPPSRTLFVTVGTTNFPSLVAAASAPAFLAAALRHGFSDVLIQHGTGPPPTPAPAPAPASPCARLSAYALKPDISADLRAAALCVSHAGAGSVFEALRARVPLLVACNPALADNHQAELAAAMGAGGHCAVARAPLTAASLGEDVGAAAARAFEPLPPATPELFVAATEAACGW